MDARGIVLWQELEIKWRQLDDAKIDVSKLEKHLSSNQCKVTVREWEPEEYIALEMVIHLDTSKKVSEQETRVDIKYPIERAGRIEKRAIELINKAIDARDVSRIIKV